MQRLHQDDLVGHVLGRDPEGWTVVSIPAIAPEDKAFALSAVPGHLHLRRTGEVLHPDREPLWVPQQSPNTFEVLEPTAPRVRRVSAEYEPEPEGAWRPRD